MRTLFLDALHGKKVSMTPIWLMRQAGRYLPEYRKIRRQFSNFMQMCKTPEACCEVALQPIHRFDLDASIIFSDILTIPDAMGLTPNFIEKKGPMFNFPIQNMLDVNKLNMIDCIERLNYVRDVILLTKQALNSRIPLIGFCGSPWTIATYMIEGKSSKKFQKIRRMIYFAPDIVHALLAKLTTVIKEYLFMQIKTGVNALMIFDSWGGLLAANNYSLFSLNYMKKIIHSIKIIYPNIPIILFTKGGGLWLDQMISSKADCLGIDWTISIKNARNIIKEQLTLQGNLDPAILYGNDKNIRLSIKNILSDEAYTSRYIFNLGHGIYPDINLNKVKFMVDTVREFGQKI